MQLAVEVQGTGFPILCLHGHPGTSRSLSVFTNHLSNRFQTIAPDLRGYGRSRPKGDFEMIEHLEDLEGVLDRFDVKHCLVLGWSLGGILAMELALKLPSRVTGLILIATAARPRGSHPKISNLDLFYTGLAGIINWVRPGWEWNMQTLGARSLFRYLIQQQTPLAYEYLAKEGTPAYLQTSAAANRALSMALKSGYNRLGDIHSITSPCLVLAGEKDRHITADSSLETAQHLPNAEWICYPNTAHLFPWEIPQEVLQDIDNWLNDHSFMFNFKVN